MKKIKFKFKFKEEKEIIYNLIKSKKDVERIILKNTNLNKLIQTSIKIKTKNKNK
jgi:hypothetical protein